MLALKIIFLGNLAAVDNWSGIIRGLRMPVLSLVVSPASRRGGGGTVFVSTALCVSDGGGDVTTWLLFRCSCEGRFRGNGKCVV